MSLNVLFLGEIVGRAGIAVLKKELRNLRHELEVDLCIANGEGTTNGFGIGAAHSLQLSKLGVDVITGGEKLYYKVDFVEFLPKCPFAIRPANFPPQSPGKPFRIMERKGRKVAIVNFISSSGFSRIGASNPFVQADHLLKKLGEEADITLVQFHSATTAECATFGHYLDGRVACVIGTHNKVMSADAAIMAGGTAFISDNGRCGADMSVGGLDPAKEIFKFTTAMPTRSWESWDDCQIQGVLVKVDEESGRATAIEPVRRRVQVEKPEVRKSDD